MFKWIYPDEYLDSTYSIDFQMLYDDGYRGVIFDIDNTLVPHGEPADVRAIDLINNLRDMGFKVFLLSNNSRARVEMFKKWEPTRIILLLWGTSFLQMCGEPKVWGLSRFWLSRLMPRKKYRL